MLAGALRRVLLIELLLYFAVACALVKVAGWDWRAAGLAVLAAALAMRAMGIAASFVIAESRASRAPPKYRLSFIAWIKTNVSELGAYIAVFSLFQPFAELLMGHLGMAFSRRIREIVLKEIRCAGG